MSAELETCILEEAAGAFATDGKVVSCERYGSGHINDTFKLVCGRPYILQRMNDDIFKDPVSLMKNIEGVTTFLRQEVIRHGGDPDRETLNLIKTRDGGTFYVDSKGNYWRMYLFIEGATCYNLVEKPEDFYQSGKALATSSDCCQSIRLGNCPRPSLVSTTRQNGLSGLRRWWSRISATGRLGCRKKSGL